jgi:signal transduction histidine kinase
MKKYLLMLFFFFSAFASAQNKTIDSLEMALLNKKEDTNKVNILLRLAFEFRERQYNIEKSIQAANEAAELAERLHFINGKGMAYRQMGFSNTNENSSASLRCHQLSLQCFQEAKNKREVANSILFIGTYYNNQGNYPEALKHYSNALNQLEILKDNAGVAGCHRWVGQSHLSQQNYPGALQHYYIALRLYEQLGDKPRIAICLSGIARAHQMQYNLQEAVNYGVRCLKTWEEIGDKIEIAYVGNGIGQLYVYLGKYNEALELHHKSLRIAGEVKDERGISLLTNTKVLLAEDYEGLADVAEAAGDTATVARMYADALVNYSEAMRVYEEKQSKGGIADQTWHLGSVYTKLKKYSLAREYLEKALQRYKELKFRPFIALTYEWLSKVDSAQGEYQKAYEHFRAYRTYYDSTLNEQTIRKAEQERMNYDFSKKEDSLKMQQLLTDQKLKQQSLLAVQQKQQLQLHHASLVLSNQQRELNNLAFLRTQTALEVEQSERHEKEKQLVIIQKEKALEEANLKLKTTQLNLKEKEIKAKRLERNVIVASSFAIIIFGLAFLKNNRRRQIAENLVEKQKMRTQIASDLHDDIGSTLTSISFYSELVKMQLPQESVEVKNMADKIGNSSRAIVNTMSDIVWVINPDNDVTENLIKRMRNHATEVCTERNIEYNFYEENEARTLQLNMQQRKNLYLIYKEALNNALKYSGCNKINISLLQSDHNLQLIVEDNGKGFDMEKANGGNGLVNMQRRAAEVHGLLSVNSNIDKGTIISLKLKIT